MKDMAATPYKAILKFKCGDGHSFQQACTVSDVNGEYFVFQDGQGDLTLPSTHGAVYLVDVVLSAAGVDTSKAAIWANGKDTGEVILGAANVGTNFSRQFMGSPVGFVPAARIRIKQAT